MVAGVRRWLALVIRGIGILRWRVLLLGWVLRAIGQRLAGVVLVGVVVHRIRREESTKEKKKKKFIISAALKTTLMS